MEPAVFYKTRIEALEKKLKELQQKKSMFGWLRFGSIAAIVAAFYVLWSLGPWYVIIASVLLLVAFVRLLYADLENKAAITHIKLLIDGNKDELKFLDANYYHFPSGQQYMPEEH